MLVIKSCEELGREFAVGDRVQIKSGRMGAHWASRMNKYKSSIMTVRSVSSGFVKMIEDYYDYDGNDEPGWNWYPWMIEGVVINSVEDIQEDPATWASGSELEALLT